MPKKTLFLDRSASDMADIILNLIRQEINKLDHTVVVRVCAVNKDGTYDIYIEPDESTIVKNITAISGLTLSKGDFAYLYKIQNQLSNSFIIKKIGV